MITHDERLRTKEARKQTGRFEDFVLKDEDGCWSWEGATHPTGAGKFTLNPPTLSQTVEYAHRVAYRIYRGPIPEGRYVAHTCDTNDCVNPDHLVCTTSAQWGKLQALLRKAARGTEIGNAKLTPQLVRWARERFASWEMNFDQLVEVLPVTDSSVHRLLQGDSWTEAGGPIEACQQRKDRGVEPTNLSREEQLQEMLEMIEAEVAEETSELIAI